MNSYFWRNLAWAGASAALAALIAAGILTVLLRTGLAWRLATDTPNQRSLHTCPTPRAGGWGVVPGFGLATLWSAPSLWPVVAAAAALALFSYWDDRHGLPARVRFAAHWLAVLTLLYARPLAGPLTPVAHFTLLALVAFAMVWFVNLYNFMDGADGLAGSMALAGFGAYGCAALAGGAGQLACGALAVVGATASFLRLNIAPARLFLGDCGSTSLGLLAGGLGYWGWVSGVWPLWFPPGAFFPFVADTTITLLRRLLRGEKVWQAHREHYYQRMIRMSGGGHRQVVRLWQWLMAGSALLALLCLGLPAAARWLCIVLGFSACAVLARRVDRHWKLFIEAKGDN